MKYKCRRCDICGAEMDNRDFQFWLKGPRLRAGCPDLRMKKYDLCDPSGNELMLCVMEAVRKKEGGEVE